MTFASFGRPPSYWLAAQSDLDACEGLPRFIRSARKNTSAWASADSLGRWSRPCFLLRHHLYGPNLGYPALGNHVMDSAVVRKQVIRALEFGPAAGEDLVTVAEFHQILVPATREKHHNTRQHRCQLEFVSV